MKAYVSSKRESLTAKLNWAGTIGRLEFPITTETTLKGKNACGK